MQVNGPDHPETNLAVCNLANLFGETLGRRSDALPLFKRAFESFSKTVGKSHQWALWAQLGMARNYSALGQHEVAIPLSRSIYDELKTTLGGNHSLTLEAQDGLALALGRSGQREEAESIFRQVIRLETENSQADPVHRRVARVYSNLAMLLLDKGEFQEAESLQRKSLVIHQQLNDNTRVAMDQVGLARVLLEQGKAAESEDDALLGNDVGFTL